MDFFLNWFRGPFVQGDQIGWGPFVQGDQIGRGPFVQGDQIGWGPFVQGDQIIGDQIGWGLNWLGTICPGHTVLDLD